jgi:hypothetical protein
MEGLGISRNTRLDLTAGGQRNANNLIHTITASCVKVFIMGYFWFSSSVFSFCPGDE